MLVVAGAAVIVGEGFSAPSGLAGSVLLIGGGTLIALGALLLLWMMKRRPIAMAAINAAPSLLVWWVAIIAEGNLDYTSPSWLETMLSILEVFGLLWAIVGSIFVVLYVKQRAEAPPTASGGAATSAPAGMTAYQRWMISVTAFGGVATIIATFLANLLK